MSPSSPLAFALIVALGAQMAPAAPTGDPDRSGAEAAFASVGRLDFGTLNFCTGTLIAPRIVLTAAHCLFDTRTGRRHALDSIRFRAGWREGRAAVERTARLTVVPRAYRYGAMTLADLSRDLALVELDRPITEVASASFGAGARPGEAVGVVSCAHDRSEPPKIEENCHVLSRQDGALVMDCEVDFGASGAPVFRWQDGWPEIVSVVSAKARMDRWNVSIGTALAAPLAALTRELDRPGRAVRLPAENVRRISPTLGRTAPSEARN